MKPLLRLLLTRTILIALECRRRIRSIVVPDNDGAGQPAAYPAFELQPVEGAVGLLLLELHLLRRLAADSDRGSRLDVAAQHRQRERAIRVATKIAGIDTSRRRLGSRTLRSRIVRHARRWRN